MGTVDEKRRCSLTSCYIFKTGSEGKISPQGDTDIKKKPNLGYYVLIVLRRPTFPCPSHDGDFSRNPPMGTLDQKRRCPLNVLLYIQDRK